MLDLIVKNGTIVNSNSELVGDLGVKDGRVVMVASPGVISDDAAKTIDATGKYVVPGGIDSHVHYDFAVSETMRAQSAAAGSRAGVYGGTTTYVDFAFQAGEEGLISSIEKKLKITQAQAVNADYALHAIVSGDFPLDIPGEIREAVSGGIVSMKMFTAFKGSEVIGGLYTDDGRIFSVMEQSQKNGALVMVHCEDECIIDYNVRNLKSQGRDQFWNIGEARPPLAEEAAVRRMLLLSERTACPLYIVHVSAKGTVDALADARARGSMVSSEVLHPQLLFGPELYHEHQGQRYMNYPPNKTEEHREALWKACKDGTIQTMASDDYTIALENKLAGDTVDNCTGGTNSVETRMAVFWSEGVVKRGVSMQRFVEMTSTNPAKIFGIYGRKGVLAPGADADIVIIDPSRTHTFRQDENLHSDCDYSNWDGFSTTGFPVTTILRGEVLVDEGKWVGPEGRGRFLEGGVPELV